MYIQNMRRITIHEMCTIYGWYIFLPFFIRIFFLNFISFITSKSSFGFEFCSVGNEQLINLALSCCALGWVRWSAQQSSCQHEVYLHIPYLEWGCSGSDARRTYKATTPIQRTSNRVQIIWIGLRNILELEKN
jgi:hypothetical protein